MKNNFAVIFLLSLVLPLAYGQEAKELSLQEQVQVAEDLERESQSGQHSKRVNRTLKQFAQRLRPSTGSDPIDPKPEPIKVSPKDIRKVGFAVGKGSAWLSTVTGKPFMAASGFLTGLFEKSDKNRDVTALYKFFLNHSKDFDQLYLEANTPEELADLMLGQFESILESKTKIMLKDFLVSVGIKRELPEDLSDFELSEDEIASIDMDKVSGEFINKHPEYKELLPILGPVSEQELTDFIMTGYFDKTIAFENYKSALPKIHEGVLTIAGQIIVPKLVLGIVSKSLAGLYATPVILADVATGISTAVCLQKSTQEKFPQDQELAQYCSYVVNRTAYQLVKSRAAGYVKGKSLRQKIEEKLKRRKQTKQSRVKLS